LNTLPPSRPHPILTLPIISRPSIRLRRLPRPTSIGLILPRCLTPSIIRLPRLRIPSIHKLLAKLITKLLLITELELLPDLVDIGITELVGGNLIPELFGSKARMMLMRPKPMGRPVAANREAVQYPNRARPRKARVFGVAAEKHE